MALQVRHRYIIRKLQEAFEIQDDESMEAMMLEPEVLSQVNHFFSADGSVRIYVTFHAGNEYGDLPGHFEVSDNPPYTQDVRVVYFLKNQRNGDGSSRYQVDTSLSNDGAISFGIINNLLKTLHTTIANVYLPILKAQSEKDWTNPTLEQKKEFFTCLEGFTHRLDESIKSLSTGLELRKPEDNILLLSSRNPTDPAVVTHSLSLMQEWVQAIDAYLDDSDRSQWETPESGPDSELEYWRSRMQRLTSISEQLKGKGVRSVVGTITLLTRSSDVNLQQRQVAMNLLQQWRGLDVGITEAATESKDNVKYLSTLERFFEPLYGTEPTAIFDTLPTLINAMKMINTIARYFNTTERMTKLFMKISNQMITCCRLAVNGKDLPDMIWEKDPTELLHIFEQCLQLNEEYQTQYRIIKEKLMNMPKGNQFDFSEAQIFGKFDLFCRRIIKLMDLFSTIQQFKCLEDCKFDGLGPLIATFKDVIKQFRGRGHDLLDYNNNSFDRDYLDFNVKMGELEGTLQLFIDRSFECISSIQASLTLLKKYQSILHRENLRKDLDSKFTIIFHNYGLELGHVEELYEKQKHSPPVSRNMPPVVGNILWCRHLLLRIEEPMAWFKEHPSVFNSREAKKIVKTYNKVARTLVAFEYLWLEAWNKSIDSAKAGLQATLIVRHEDSNRLFVNFDQEIFRLIRESKCLDKLELEIPEGANLVLKQEEKFKRYFDELSYALSAYEDVKSQIIPITDDLLSPHLKTLDLRLRPGLVTLTWTSMNISVFMQHTLGGIQKMEELVSKINDIVENRIQKNLKIISRANLVDLPNDRNVTLDEFVQMQEGSVSKVTQILMGKNLEIENAVGDVIDVVNSFPLDPSVNPPSDEKFEDLRNHFRTLLYQAVLNCTMSSLHTLKKRVFSRSSSSILFVDRPFFEVDVQLSVPSVRLSPTLDDVQRAINKACVVVLGFSKKMFEWGQQDIPEWRRVSLFETLGQDIDVIKCVLLLTGAMYGTKNLVHDYLKSFKIYDWLWKEDKEGHYRQFVSTNPSISDFEDELVKFMSIEAEIEAINSIHNIGALSLNTTNLKLQLSNESRQWKIQYSNKVHQQAKERMYSLFEYIRVITNKLNIEIENIDGLRYVMNVLKEIREKESSIEMDITPTLEMYAMLEHYLPPGFIDKEEVDQKGMIRSSWRKMVDYAEDVTNNLQAIQGTYKKQLIWNSREFIADIKSFREDFEKNGPIEEGIEPQEAVKRLKRFNEGVILRERKMEVIRAGEELFAMRPTPFLELTKTRKEVNILELLYSLYVDVDEALDGWRDIYWADLPSYIDQIEESLESFELRSRKLPKRLREWKAYELTKDLIENSQLVFPLIRELSKSSIKDRHWEELNLMLSAEIPYQGIHDIVDDGETKGDVERMKVRHVLDTKVTIYQEEVEELCDGADKQLQIESKLESVTEQWQGEAFEFVPWKNRGIPVLRGFGGVIEELEESQLQLQALLSMRHVTPFRAPVQKKLTELSDASETLELWVKVQMLWTSLESVFSGGDIARQMPLEAKKFVKINKEWDKMMQRAHQTKGVLLCCSNELLKNALPSLYIELEKCQKSLEGYLEQKRGRFPRFYFVSNPALLIILSQGSDPLQMQPYYEKVFDSISHVIHDKVDKTRITHIESVSGAEKETICLINDGIKANGNIEDWLGQLEKSMQLSLKGLCEDAAATCSSLPLREFVDSQCAQFALLGIQFAWTAQSQEALEQCRQNKSIMHETCKAQLGTLQQLSVWCLEDLGTKMNRTKIETLVTIQVHQRDVFADLTRLFKERKLQVTGLGPAADFEWLKQTRFYWNMNKQDDLGPGSCVVSVCDIEFQNSFEYLGCKERLVITPLTDRCYITLSQAIGMYLGGAPAGPAGTGKTETVKDLGRSLGVFVIVTNCTDQQRFGDMAKIFKGLCRGGLWGCFDEFNRIELPVLSVVAQQVLSITNARRNGSKTFQFPGDQYQIPLKLSVNYCITMNPGYQGRQELPENLKALFRGVAMMVPDREIIMKVKLCSAGYQEFTDLSHKFNILYHLCEQQLSVQKHYDWGLRNILSVLRTAGQTKRDNPSSQESHLLMATLRSMNLSKLVAQDVPLFLSLIADIFPDSQFASAQTSHEDVRKEIEKSIQERGLISKDEWKLKMMQLYETNLVRHGIMLVGPAGSGKSEIISQLQHTLTVTTEIQHKTVRMNAKAIRVEEMFGETDRLSGEWLDGVFGAMWEKFNKRNRKDIIWLVCDSPVDAIWIENLNTVLDDNKILTLANGDRIPMTDNVKLLFEVEDLRNASPATVSRAGIIYVSETDLDWLPILEAWLQKLNQPNKDILTNQFTKYLGPPQTPQDIGALFSFVERHCAPMMRIPRVSLIQSVLSIVDGMLPYADLASEDEIFADELERLVVFAIGWGIGGVFEARDRIKLDEYMRSFGSTLFPHKENGDDSIFEYSLNLDSMDWEKWKVPSWEYPSRQDGVSPAYYRMLVPTIETQRSFFLLSSLKRMGIPIMITGGSGTAKTTTSLMFCDTLDCHTEIAKRVNFSSATTPLLFQNTLEGELDKRGGKSFGPSGGRKMTVFLDDLSMPEINEWGDQPTLELCRQLVETKTMCFLEKDKRGDLKIIEDIHYLTAMSHPSGGRQGIPYRLLRHFFVLNLLTPSYSSIHSIFGQILTGKYKNNKAVPKTIIQLIDRMPGVTTEVWEWMRDHMLPSPTKFHYSFTLRDLSQIFEGLHRSPVDCCLRNDGADFAHLWRHECERVFSDKLITNEDKGKFKEILDTMTMKLVSREVNLGKGGETDDDSSLESTSKKQSSKRKKDKKGGSSASTTSNVTVPIIPFPQSEVEKEIHFANFFREDEYDDDGFLVNEAPQIYEQAESYEFIKERVSNFLNVYNEENPSSAMELVLFHDAMTHVIRISRILGLPRGNALLVGVGGSGKRSLTKLASYIAKYKLFQISMTKGYNMSSFLDDLRELYKQCGQQRIPTTFLFQDTDVKDENFLEVINCILTTGEVSGLFPKDELQMMAGDLRQFAFNDIEDFMDTPDNLIQYFIDTVRDNLHIILCMSPINPKFPERARRFPGIISSCSCDWFLPWPEEALVSVAASLMEDFDLANEESSIKDELIQHMGGVHQIVVDMCEEYFIKLRRSVYQTPKSFLSFIETYKSMYLEKKLEIEDKSNRVILGLDKLAKGGEDVEQMKYVLEGEELKLKKAEETTNEMLSKLEESSMEAKREADAVSKIKEKCEIDRERIAGEKADAEADLATAQPFVDQAERAVNSIRPNDLVELKKLQKPSDIIKLIFDCVSILKMEVILPVEPNEITLGIGKDKRAFTFIKDSYKLAQQGILADMKFLQNIFYFSKYEKDLINDETVELIAPYLELDGFTPMVAKNASRAAEGLCTWVRAMKSYQEASKVVQPKLEALRLAEARLSDAEMELQEAETNLKMCQGTLLQLQDAFDDQINQKRQIEENATKTKKRMEQATSLIEGLAGERERWVEDSKTFHQTKMKLVGDVALACGFLSYCGPFNQNFREILVSNKFKIDLATRGIPNSTNQDLTDFLVDAGTTGEWNMEGLPTDPLSIQNGILVTHSSRYPLLIDPQGQALNWIRNHEAAQERIPAFGTTEFTNVRFRDQLEFCMGEGLCLIVNGVEDEIDPLLTPVLDKTIITKAKTKYISISNKLCEYSDDFRLYLLTKLPNPHISPEDQAKTTLIDCTVTQHGLEEQLLGKVIRKEQRSLEDQLNHIMGEVTMNTKSLIHLNEMLLQRLTENTGNLLDDVQLIEVLGDTKKKSNDVKEKLIAADEMKISINEKREQYRPVATRGSILYFSIIEVSLMNSMYQTSLDQFLVLFEKSMDEAEKASLASKRVGNIIETLTYITYRYINQGLYETDKLGFKLIIALKILTTAGGLDNGDISLFLKGGDGLDPNTAKQNPFSSWLSSTAWMNILALSSDHSFYKTLPEEIGRNENSWRAWYLQNEPEKLAVPVYETRYSSFSSSSKSEEGEDIDPIGAFYKLLLVRCLRQDRTISTVKSFIQKFERIEVNGQPLPAMGEAFMETVTDSVDMVYRSMDHLIPVIFLLSSGADPTSAIEHLARKKKYGIECVSMGEGQEKIAEEAISVATMNGTWVLLQNCHLGLDFMDKIEGLVSKSTENMNTDFRLFITTEPHPEFPISLLQLSTKVTTEPPSGLKAGLQRSFSTLVDQDKIDRIETVQ